MLAPAFMRGPRRGERWVFWGFERDHVPAGSVRWRGELSCFWKNSWKEGDPQKRGYRSSGWTVPMLKGELAKAGYVVSERTVRRTLKRL